MNYLFKRCWSPVGYAPDYKYQELSLGDGCMHVRLKYKTIALLLKLLLNLLKKGTVMHEVGHSLGFFHEQSRSDRDNFVNIVYKNIASFRELNFEKYDDTEIENLEPYDLSSDMHYGSLYFSANNKVTIATKDARYQKTIGQRLDLSFTDIKTANNVYCKST